MSRYFIEVAYKGTDYAGFQVQQNANTIQAEIEKTLEIFFHKKFNLTGASRTDAGVHAFQNFFHFDMSDLTFLPKFIYNLNAILPPDIVIKNVFEVGPENHARFDAFSRSYTYNICQKKDPFLKDISFFYPYTLNIENLNLAANLIRDYKDFTSFSKRNTQVNNYNCDILNSYWVKEDDIIKYNVTANRFLRGMVRGLVGTMLRVGTGKLTLQQFVGVIESKDCSRADFSVPPNGLFLNEIKYPHLDIK